ncbi:MAG: prenylated flavin chaperone LpdD [Candidatus Hodarchaeales archaeon]|jgi:hypothetical protein
MEKIAQFKARFESYQITTVVYSKTDGLIVDVVTPNEHLGGIGVGMPYTRRNGVKSANFHCISLPAHRDAELAGNLAQIVAKNTEIPVIVLLGIHIPDITRIQIQRLTGFFEKWFMEISLKLTKNSFLNSHKADQ